MVRESIGIKKILTEKSDIFNPSIIGLTGEQYRVSLIASSVNGGKNLCS
jgi:hypothetical protein